MEAKLRSSKIAPGKHHHFGIAHTDIPNKHYILYTQRTCDAAIALVAPAAAAVAVHGAVHAAANHDGVQVARQAGRLPQSRLVRRGVALW